MRYRAVLSGGMAIAVAVVVALSLPAFRHADAPRDFRFPRDHASHPSFQTEWWYFTGSVRDAESRNFGYELTFFRVAMRADHVESASPWRARDLMIAHLGVTDVDGKRFVVEENIQRAAAGLAGADTTHFRTWIGEWEARTAEPEATFRLRANGDQLGIDLRLIAEKDPVLHGPGGLSPKDSSGRAASYYYSMPRLRTDGSLRLADDAFDVTGATWMDHEFFTGDTPTEGLGWDWFSARLEDGRDLMLYLVRHPDGETFRFATLVSVDGTSRPLDTEGLTVQPRDFWTSPATGTRYPISWSLELPAEQARLDVRALIPQQEVRASETVGFAYWEGLCAYSGTWNGKPVAGEGYVELTGY